MLRRPLTDGEYELLFQRKVDIAPWIAGYDPSEKDRVVLALLDMFAAFPTMRQEGIDIAGFVDNLARLLETEPAWAIEVASKRIATEGYEINGHLERHWSPSMPEIIFEVERTAKLYRGPHDSAVALLTAEVER